MDRKMTILIVDDSEINRSILRGIFETSYKILEAGDGIQALEVLDEEKEVDLIILDILMPRMDGLTFLKKIKEDEILKRIPVVVNTQIAEQEKEYQALALGADDLILKPYNPKIVRKRIENMLTKRVYERNVMQRVVALTQDYFDSVMEIVPSGVAIFDYEDGLNLEYINDGLCTLLGYGHEELVNLISTKPTELVQEKDYRDIVGFIKDNREGTLTEKIQLFHHSGEKIWSAVKIRNTSAIDGKRKIYIVFTDVSEEKMAELRLHDSMKKLRYQAERDMLTGLYNRVTFCSKASEWMHQNPDENYLILFINIDRFKVINELLGTKSGDKLLVGFARLLQKRIKKEGVYSRFSADHFMVCMRKDYFEHDLDFFEELFDGKASWNPVKYPIQAHIGIYEVENIDDTVDTMCEKATMALQVIKGNYLQHWKYYNESIKTVLINEQELTNDMEEALLNREFVVYYQPIVDADTQKIVSAEALIRWNHHSKGLISPGVFIPIFEKNGFIAKLDMYVCEEICHFQAQRLRTGQFVVPISVNISRINFYNPDLNDIILGMLHQYGVTTNLVKIEVTESAYHDNPKDLLRAVKGFQNSGFKVLMDDFGSGYSSLNMLKDIQIDILKLDMKFLDNLETSDVASNILFSIIQMAKAIHMETVAEGVETRAQYELLTSMGCDMIQGYYFSKPIQKKDFIKLLDAEQDNEMMKDKESGKQTVLIVDDIELNRIAMRENIQEKYSIIEAVDGLDALETLKRNFRHIVLVISDIYMPNLSGFELLEKMQEFSYLKNIPVLMVTAYGDSKNEEKALELGALDVVTKPFEPEILKKRITNLLAVSEKSTIEREVKALREMVSIKKHIQSSLASNVVGVCRMSLEKGKDATAIKVVYVNDVYRYLHQIGKESDSITIEECIEYIFESDRERIYKLLRNAVANEKKNMQFSYHVLLGESRKLEVVSNCSIQYTQDMVYFDFVDLEDTQEDMQISETIEHIVHEVGTNTGFHVWTYDLDEDYIEFSIEKKGEKFERKVVMGVKEKVFGSTAFLESDKPKLNHIFDEIYRGVEKISEVFLIRPKDASEDERYHWYRITHIKVKEQMEGRMYGRYIAIAQDITENKENDVRKWRERQYREVLEKGAMFFAEVDLTDNVFMQEETRMQLRILGLDASISYDDFVEKYLAGTVDAEEREGVVNHFCSAHLLAEYKKGRSFFEREFFSNIEKTDSDIYQWYNSKFYLVTNPENNHIYGSLKICNVQDERSYQMEIEKRALQDALTGLLSRSAFENSILGWLKEFESEGVRAAFFMIDADNFKAVNDNFGHSFGDNVLKSIGSLLRMTFGKNAFVSRIGGDEFAAFISCRNLSDDEAIQKGMSICHKSRMEFDNLGNKIQVSCSCGITFGYAGQTDFQTFYTQADSAMYHAKRAGKNQIYVYDAEKEEKENG